MNGHLILIMAPSGSGKGTLLKHLRDVFPEAHFAISCMTRAIRPGEVDGVTAYFKTREVFQEMVENGDFIEHVEYGGNLSGTLKSEVIDPLKKGELVIREMELQGVQAISKVVPKENRTIIYVDAGGWDVLEKRIRARAPITEEELQKRKERYEKESRSKDVADIILPNPDGKLEETKKELARIIEAQYNTHI